MLLMILILQDSFGLIYAFVHSHLQFSILALPHNRTSSHSGFTLSRIPGLLASNLCSDTILVSHARESIRVGGLSIPIQSIRFVLETSLRPWTDGF